MHDLTTLARRESEERHGGVEQQAAAGCEEDRKEHKCLVKGRCSEPEDARNRKGCLNMENKVQINKT